MYLLYSFNLLKSQSNKHVTLPRSRKIIWPKSSFIAIDCSVMYFLFFVMTKQNAWVNLYNVNFQVNTALYRLLLPLWPKGIFLHNSQIPTKHQLICLIPVMNNWTLIDQNIYNIQVKGRWTVCRGEKVINQTLLIGRQRNVPKHSLTNY